MNNDNWDVALAIYEMQFRHVGINKVILNGAEMLPEETIRFNLDGSLWLNENCDDKIVDEAVRTCLPSLAFARDASFADAVLSTFSRLDGRFVTSGEKVREIKTGNVYHDDANNRKNNKNVERLKECFDILRMFNSDPEREIVGGTTKDALAFELVNIVLMDGSGIRSRLFGYKDNKLIRAMANAKEGKYRYLEKKNDRQAIEELDKLADRLVTILTQY